MCDPAVIRRGPRCGGCHVRRKVSDPAHDRPLDSGQRGWELSRGRGLTCDDYDVEACASAAESRIRGSNPAKTVSIVAGSATSIPRSSRYGIFGSPRNESQLKLVTTTYLSSTRSTFA